EFIKEWGVDTAPWVKELPRPLHKEETQNTIDSPKHRMRITKWKLHKNKNNQITHIWYSVVGNRFCMNKKRWHKSNGIYFVISLDKCELRQKCFDVECKGFESPPVQIPSYILEEQNDLFDLQLIDMCEKIEQQSNKSLDNDNRSDMYLSNDASPTKRNLAAMFDDEDINSQPENQAFCAHQSKRQKVIGE
ncbi:hypothetical protein RFI_11330, partial [Reticulomyxa filosa]